MALGSSFGLSVSSLLSPAAASGFSAAGIRSAAAAGAPNGSTTGPAEKETDKIGVSTNG